jgi:hypothetical protein
VVARIAPTPEESARLQEGTRLAREIGFDAEFETVPLTNQPGVRFTDQARIHPRSYLAGVARPLSPRLAAFSSARQPMSYVTTRERHAPRPAPIWDAS